MSLHSQIANVNFETLEPRLLMSSGADLTGYLSCFSFNVSGDLLPGAKGAAVVTVSNVGDTQALGKATVAVYASTDGTLNSSDILLGTSRATALNLQPGASSNVNIKLVLPASMPADSYYIITQITTAIPQSETDNNVAVADQSMEVQAPVIDLTGAVQMCIADQLIGGGKGTAYVDVVNQGNIPAVGKTDITIYASSDWAFDSSSVAVGSLPSAAVNLQPNADKTYQVKVTMPACLAADDYYFFAVVDASNKLPDVDPTNNVLLAPQTTTLVAATVDLTGSLGNFSLNYSSTGDLLPGAKGSAVVTVSNGGNSLALGKETVSVYASSDGTLDSSAVLLGASRATSVKLQPGASADVNIKLALPATLPADSYFIITQITTTGITESDTDNNVAVTDQIMEVQAPVIDLTGSVQMNIADQLVGSGKGTAYVDVVNQGNIAAIGKSAITIYASATGAFDSSCVVVGNLASTAINLQPNQDKTYQVNVTMPSSLAADDYFFFAVIDSGNHFADVDPTNNILLAPQTTTVVTNTVDLGVDFSWTDLSSTPSVGDTGTAYLNVTNFGNAQAAGRLTIQIYACQNPELDDTAVLIGSSAGKATVLAAGNTNSYGVHVTVPQSLSGNSWFLIAKITYLGSVLDTDTLNDVALSDTTLDLS